MTKFCGFSCSLEKKKLMDIMTNLRIFAEYNPGHATKVIDDYVELVLLTKYDINNISKKNGQIQENVRGTDDSPEGRL